MATYIINSRLFGEKKFTLGYDGGIVRVNGQEACYGGGVSGYIIRGMEENLPNIARKWWRQYLANERKLRRY